MKIAFFYPDASFAPWSMGLGLARALERAGHVVLAGKLPVGDGVSLAAFDEMKAKLPTLEALGDTDLVLVSGPELIVPWLEAVYGKYEWKHSIKGRKLAWYQSPFFNDQVNINFDYLSYFADEHFFPAVQDVDFFDQEGLAKGRAHWLPFGVDTKMFDAGKRLDPRVDRRFDLVHIGSFGEKAGKYMGALSQHEHPPVRVAEVKVVDLEGFLETETAHLLALNLRAVKIFVNFPGPNYLEAKLLEAMACGAMVLTPLLTAARGTDANHSMFENGTHWLCYAAGNVPSVARLLRTWASDEKAEEREKIAVTGLAEVRMNHSIDMRLETMFARLGVKEVVQ